MDKNKQEPNPVYFFIEVDEYEVRLMAEKGDITNCVVIVRENKIIRPGNIHPSLGFVTNRNEQIPDEATDY